MTDEQVGSLAQEALKLARVLAAQTADGGAADGHAADGHAAHGPTDVGDPSTGAPESGHTLACDYCPLCQLIAIVRNARPEVAEHLSSALVSLTLAARGVVETWAQSPDPRRGEARGSDESETDGGDD